MAAADPMFLSSTPSLSSPSPYIRLCWFTASVLCIRYQRTVQVGGAKLFFCISTYRPHPHPLRRDAPSSVRELQASWKTYRCHPSHQHGGSHAGQLPGGRRPGRSRRRDRSHRGSLEYVIRHVLSQESVIVAGAAYCYHRNLGTQSTISLALSCQEAELQLRGGGLRGRAA